MDTRKKNRKNHHKEPYAKDNPMRRVKKEVKSWRKVLIVKGLRWVNWKKHHKIHQNKAPKNKSILKRAMLGKKVIDGFMQLSMDMDVGPNKTKYQGAKTRMSWVVKSVHHCRGINMIGMKIIKMCLINLRINDANECCNEN